MSIGKDSDLVAVFQSQFQKLRSWIDDEPEGLTELSKGDSILSVSVRKAAFDYSMKLDIWRYLYSWKHRKNSRVNDFSKTGHLSSKYLNSRE